MRVIHAAQNPAEAHLLSMLLEERGIESTILNEALQSASGDFGLAPTVATQVAILDPAQEAAALAIVEEMLATARGEGPHGDPWMCAACGEENESSFEICWQCQKPRAGLETSS